MKKRVITIIIAIAIVVISAIPAFAVTEINSYEQQILDLVNDGIDIGDRTLDISRYYNQAYNYFLENDKLNSQDQVNEIKDDIAAAATALVGYGIKVDEDNTASFDVSGANVSGKTIRDDMLGRINSLGSEYGITGSYDPVKDVLTLKMDGVGEFNSEDLIKQTGSESMVAPMVIGAALVLVVAVAGVFVYNNSRKIKD